MDTDVVVFATGVRPRDELARAAGLEVGERGGVVVDDACRTSDPAVWAVGEVACIEGRVWGLVAPGYAMAEVVVDRLLGGAATFPGADSSTKLKLLGVDVASFGDAFAAEPGGLEVVYADPVAGVYKKLVLSDDARTLRGGILVGDASAYAALRPMLGRPLGADPAAFVAPEGAGAAVGSRDLPDDAGVCSCNNVSAGEIRCAVTEKGCTDVKARRGLHACRQQLRLVPAPGQAARRGRAGGCRGRGQLRAVRALRPVAGAAVRRGARAGPAHLQRHRRPARAWARLRRLQAGRRVDPRQPRTRGHVLEGERASLQDTNDHVMANLQKDGSYSVVPRIPGGEVTPDGLIAIGEVAREFGLYTKITGGQRIDLFGARIEQLPLIWRRLVDAGFESGHAYGKALRTVKSCVGSTWCRYGVQDSVALAVALELRYRGLRSPHKLKLAVSGCARECAEARSKDVGVIATDKGWNLYVGGNGGFTPRHAVLLAEDLDTETLVRTIDRFLMYYVRTADRLQRTAPWLEAVEGGLDHVRAVVLDDSLGIAADLDAAMARHVDGLRRRVARRPRRPGDAEPVRVVRQRTRPARPVAGVRGRARAASSGHRVREGVGCRAGRRPDAGGAPVTPVEARPATWVTVCRLDDLLPERGVAALVGGRQVALVRLVDDTLYAVDQLDPFSGAYVMSRGIVGTATVDGEVVPTLASPMYKQVFDLRTGACLGDPRRAAGHLDCS